MNNLAHVFQAMLKEEEKRAADFAKAVDVAPANITRVMQGQTPSDELLRKMCDAKNWNDPFRGLRVLEARLRDVIEASGHTLEEIYPCIASEESKGISQDLTDINNYMRRNPDLYRMISMMADSVRQATANSTPKLTVAVDNPEGGIDTTTPDGIPPGETQVGARRKDVARRYRASKGAKNQGA